ncbi:PREDICTED: uncharacterized protein LOC106805910 [Priapulus caudatus]|uniref:Uncharacterized protein LOC106805910 n=1 Tax=Priapulus caudatus TaxID=37621 RepID=A0ABM1DT96_PRICU|nr:PREDICTED: uncharacterized protein LOC106805910 [Priapulus caudatus]
MDDDYIMYMNSTSSWSVDSSDREDLFWGNTWDKFADNARWAAVVFSCLGLILNGTAVAMQVANFCRRMATNAGTMVLFLCTVLTFEHASYTAMIIAGKYQDPENMSVHYCVADFFVFAFLLFAISWTLVLMMASRVVAARRPRSEFSLVRIYWLFEVVICILSFLINIYIVVLLHLEARRRGDVTHCPYTHFPYLLYSILNTFPGTLVPLIITGVLSCLTCIVRVACGMRSRGGGATVAEPGRTSSRLRINVAFIVAAVGTLVITLLNYAVVFAINTGGLLEKLGKVMWVMNVLLTAWTALVPVIFFAVIPRVMWPQRITAANAEITMTTKM